MVKHRVIAVDDEPLALRRLEIILGSMDDVELIGTASNVAAALQLIAHVRPDAVLLDIAMPGKTGFDLLDELPPGQLPAIIFVTAYDRYAVEAFDRNAVGYVLKPVQPERLRRALDQARRILTLEERSEQLKHLLSDLGAAERGADIDDEIWAHRYGELVRVPVGDVTWAQAERDYVRLHTERNSYLVRETMDNLQRRLDPRQFVRVHRSALVRTSRILSVKRRATGLLVAHLAGGQEVKIGRRYAKNFAAAKTLLRAQPAGFTVSATAM